MSLSQHIAQVKGRLEMRGIMPNRVHIEGFQHPDGGHVLIVRPAPVSTPLATDLIRIALEETGQPGRIGVLPVSVVIVIGVNATSGMPPLDMGEAPEGACCPRPTWYGEHTENCPQRCQDCRGDTSLGPSRCRCNEPS